MKAEILTVRFVHESWSRFGIARVRLADGAVVEREIEDHGDSVGILPYDPERKVATLVRELRVPPLFAAGEQVQLEAPAGLIDAGSPEKNARREALEEVGLRLRALEFVGATYSCASLTTEKIHLYLAPYGRADRAEAGGGAEGEHENIRVVEMPLSELAACADRAEITDLKTLALILALRARHSELFAP
ncbi:nudix-type nucleoside diphosphatase, YffH/AdpP family [Methylobacterium sp. 275MFSha3.1]|uniref:NUDIX domain-containing protein n=1 Tax=Methylobacterium sp. 275MFSha3.1 TaxID=1502746 RepID=UPI0008A7C3C4|nr:NUDIX hydrolase [Methylobacterium sp. 275MFSha3.1]SEH48783.1 nudix-type nucleoside diphosphatase, YffH/AdpP family [Methylobacterium sp. 275MFSha3.1]